jgi:hypothetical protein
VGWTEVPQPTGSVYGDHVDHLFVSKSDPNEQLLVITDECAGCVQGSSPASLAPTGTANVVAISATEAAFASSGNARSLSSYWNSRGTITLPANYETNGLVLFGPPNGSPAYFIVAITLPVSEYSLATRVLNSALRPT